MLELKRAQRQNLRNISAALSQHPLKYQGVRVDRRGVKNDDLQPFARRSEASAIQQKMSFRGLQSGSVIVFVSRAAHECVIVVDGL